MCGDEVLVLCTLASANDFALSEKLARAIANAPQGEAASKETQEEEDTKDIREDDPENVQMKVKYVAGPAGDKKKRDEKEVGDDKEKRDDEEGNNGRSGTKRVKAVDRDGKQVTSLQRFGFPYPFCRN